MPPMEHACLISHYITEQIQDALAIRVRRAFQDESMYAPKVTILGV